MRIEAKGMAGVATGVFVFAALVGCRSRPMPNPGLIGRWQSVPGYLDLNRDGTFEKVYVNSLNPFQPRQAANRLILPSPPTKGRWEEREHIVYMNREHSSEKEAYRWELTRDDHFDNLSLTPVAAGRPVERYVRIRSLQNTLANPEASVDPVEALVSETVDRLNAWWAPEVALNAGKYVPPRIVRSNTPLPGKAVYTSKDNTVTYEYAFMDDKIRRPEFGKPGAAIVLAHEWGHLVQAQCDECLTDFVETELQADCFAGVYAQDEKRRERFTDSDIQRAGLAIITFGDLFNPTSTGAEPLSPVSERPRPGMERYIARFHKHGSSMSREIAFKRGYKYGLSGCACEAMKELGAQPW